MPRSESDRDGLSSRISLSTWRTSLGLVEFGLVISSPAPTIPATGKPLSTGRDLHRLVDALATGRPEADVDDEDRLAAEAVNFGLPRGLGVETCDPRTRPEFTSDFRSDCVRSRGQPGPAR
jgi:hypothetical protein